MALGPLEYLDSGFITHVDRRATQSPILRKSASILRKSASRYESKVVEGNACLWLKPHRYRGCVDVFERGCFNATLSSKKRVDFCIDHLNYSLGHTDDNLELIDTKDGLAFRLRTKSEADLNLLNGRNAMSVKYAEHEVEVRKIEDCEVRFIKSATLIECSAVFDGAVPKTHLIVRDTETVGRLRDDSENKFPSDSTFVDLMRALKKLDAS